MILFALAVAAATGSPSVAAPPKAVNVAADPLSVNAILASVPAGATVRLVAGSYPIVTIRARSFDPPITVDASAATVAGVQVISSSGVRWTGGVINGLRPTDGGANVGFGATLSSQIVVDGVHVSGFRTGIAFDRVTGGAITGNWLAHMTSDGIDLGRSRSVTIARNTCTDFTPSDLAHPDCIQAWSRPDAAPVSDLVITGNSAVGAMQGISLFNHVRDGVDDGGFDRISISNNNVLVIYGDGISVYSCRGCSVRNNSVNSLPNYYSRAQLSIIDGSVDQCGNVVAMVPRQGTPPCPSGG
ncbi:MAG: right-handed parallel beta-helix repeat-containing protein [Sphingomonadaceae bacterium]|nr:right-handed parallel beta-helix repeat-containing protein [Sphingomonadaceae bacterium]